MGAMLGIVTSIRMLRQLVETTEAKAEGVDMDVDIKAAVEDTDIKAVMVEAAVGDIKVGETIKAEVATIIMTKTIMMVIIISSRSSSLDHQQWQQLSIIMDMVLHLKDLHLKDQPHQWLLQARMHLVVTDTPSLRAPLNLILMRDLPSMLKQHLV
jgi:hypothetical protein